VLKKISNCVRSIIVERSGHIGQTEQCLIGGPSFLTTSGGMPVQFEDKERIEGKSRLQWEGAGILTREKEKESLSILRDRKSEFERTTILFVSGSIFSKGN
jgi:hypothetical protein